MFKASTVVINVVCVYSLAVFKIAVTGGSYEQFMHCWCIVWEFV